MDADTLEILTLLQQRKLIVGLGNPLKRTPRCLYIDHCGKLWPLVPISANSSAVESPDLSPSPSAAIKKWRIQIYRYNIKEPWLLRTSSWRKYPNWIPLWLCLQLKYRSSNYILPVRILVLFDNTEYLAIHHLSDHVGTWLK